MAKHCITLPEGLANEAHRHGICVSYVAACALKSEIVSKVEQEKKAGIYEEKKS